MLGREWIQNHPAADRHLRRISPQNKSIAEHGHDGRFESQLCESSRSRFYFAFVFQHADSRENFGWNYEPALRAAGIPFCTTDQPAAVCM